MSEAVGTFMRREQFTQQLIVLEDTLNRVFGAARAEDAIIGSHDLVQALGSLAANEFPDEPSETIVGSIASNVTPPFTREENAALETGFTTTQQMLKLINTGVMT